MPRHKKTEAEKQADLVYEAEWAAGCNVLRPLLSVVEAQYLVDYVLKSRYWKSHCGIRQVKVEYIPRWERLSEMEDRRTTGDMRLSMGNLTEGVVYHELAHCARGDTDNSHGPEYCDMLIGLLEQFASSIVANRFREELHIRKLI